MTTDTQTLPVTASRSGFRWRRFLIAFAATLVVLIAVASAAAFAYASGNSGRILSGVTIGGVSVAGMTPEDAKDKLLTTLPNVTAGSLTIKAGSVEQKIPYAEIGRGYDLDATIEDAMAVGRQGNPLDQLAQQLRTMSTGVALTPTVSYDESALQARVAQIVATAQSTPADAEIVFQNGQYVVTPAVDGQNVDANEVLRQSFAALDTDSVSDTTVTVPATTTSASVSTPDAQAAVTKLEAVTSVPLVLTVGSTSHTIDSATLRGWVHLDQSAPGQWTVVVDRGPIDQLVGILKTQVDQPAVEAQFKFDANGATTVPGATGYEVDASGSGDAIYNAIVGRSAGTPAEQVTLPVTSTVPDFTTEEAQALASKVKLLGTWTTKYVPSKMNGGGQNIRRPADLIDGTVVQPGAVFDFVGVAGPITKANGYSDGAAIIHGKTKGEGVLGGGLCSASTTAFNAALRAGFELGARRNHAYYISRYPVGLDATIWISGSYTQTMSFTNDSDYPIVIRGINKKRSVTFEIWGVDDGRTVTLSDPKVTNTKKASVYYEFTDTLPARATEVSEYKADGFDSVVIRTVRDAAGNIIHQDTITSSYRRVDGIILVGRYPGDPPAGTRWPVSQGIPNAPGPKPTATPGPTHTAKPTNNPTPTPDNTPKPTKKPTPTPTTDPTPSTDPTPPPTEQPTETPTEAPTP
jgi:vancomycin resistance protein YoaR